MDRLTKLKQLRAKRAQARKALEKADTAANRAVLEDVEAELANAESDAKDDERVASVSVGLMPLVEQLSKSAVEPTKSWVQCDARQAKKHGALLDPDRLAAQAEELIGALTRLRPS